MFNCVAAILASHRSTVPLVFPKHFSCAGPTRSCWLRCTEKNHAIRRDYIDWKRKKATDPAAIRAFQSNIDHRTKSNDNDKCLPAYEFAKVTPYAEYFEIGGDVTMKLRWSRDYHSKGEVKNATMTQRPGQSNFHEEVRRVPPGVTNYRERKSFRWKAPHLGVKGRDWFRRLLDATDSQRNTLFLNSIMVKICWEKQIERSVGSVDLSVSINEGWL